MNISAEDIFCSVNQVRENPSLVLNEIKEQLKRFESNSIYRTKRDIKIRTLSGKVAWQDAVLALERQKSKGNFQWNSILASAAECVAAENESVNPFDVIRSICSCEGNISFNVNESDAEQDLMEIMAAMVVGDGDEKKGSRTAIFHPLFREFGCAVHKKGNKLLIFTLFAQSVSESTQPLPGKGSFGAQLASRSQGAPHLAKREGEITKKWKIQRGKDLIVELNKIRKEPKQYVLALKAELQKFKDEKTIVADHGTIITKEGQAPYYDLISELESQYPLPSIREISGLTLVALEQLTEVESIVESKVPVDILLDKFCVASEGIRSIKLREVEGMPISAMLMRLLVGDGDRKRTGRRKLLSPICRAVGCAIGMGILIVNVGQSAQDNKDFVEEYMRHLDDDVPSLKRQTQHNIQARSFEEVRALTFAEERFVVKRTSKTHHEQRNGRMYMVKEVEAIYSDGFIERVTEEELVR